VLRPVEVLVCLGEGRGERSCGWAVERTTPHGGEHGPFRVILKRVERDAMPAVRADEFGDECDRQLLLDQAEVDLEIGAGVADVWLETRFTTGRQGPLPSRRAGRLHGEGSSSYVEQIPSLPAARHGQEQFVGEQVPPGRPRWSSGPRSSSPCTAHSATADVTYTNEFAPTVNDDECVAIAGEAAVRAPGEDRVRLDAEPIMASEDFGVLADHVPACLALIGNGIAPGEGGTPLHSHDYTFNDDILTAGVAYYRQVVRSSLGADKQADVALMADRHGEAAAPRSAGPRTPAGWVKVTRKPGSEQAGA
jgi:hypothetical protein